MERAPARGAPPPLPLRDRQAGRFPRGEEVSSAPSELSELSDASASADPSDKIVRTTGRHPGRGALFLALR